MSHPIPVLDETTLGTCVLCPRLCRPACPVATGSAREAAVPTLIASALLRYRRGTWDREATAQALHLCVDCGACQEHCHLHQPLPQLLREARAELGPELSAEPLRPIEGDGTEVAVENQDRPFAPALARALQLELGSGLGRWLSTDRLGAALIGQPQMAAQAEQLRRHSRGRRLVVADGGIALALREAQVPFVWLHDRLPQLRADALGSCATHRTANTESDAAGPMACCGGADPLRTHHPEDAARVGRYWQRMASSHSVLDARCRTHLQGCGGPVEDTIDRLHKWLDREG